MSCSTGLPGLRTRRGEFAPSGLDRDTVPAPGTDVRRTGRGSNYEKWIDGGRKAADKPVLATYFTGPPIPPDPDEALSYKDTFKSYPETVTRIITDPWSPPMEPIAGIANSGTELPATYVHHCHLLEHEDDDLMRPFTIVDPGAPEGEQGGDDGHDGGHGGGHGR